MPPDTRLPASLAGLLVVFRSYLIASTCRKFTALVLGFSPNSRTRTWA